VILMYIKNIKWINYPWSIDKWHFDSLEKTTLPPLARHLFSAMKEKMVNTLSKFTMFLLTCYRKSRSHISFFLYHVIYWFIFRPHTMPWKSGQTSISLKKIHFSHQFLTRNTKETLETSLNPFIVLSHHLISPKMKYQPRS